MIAGITDADHNRQVMRERRLERKNAEDMAGYKAAFHLIDVDRSG